MTARKSVVEGFSLLEVLVAMLLLSLALLGLARLQTYSLQTTNSAYYRTQATALANDMIERIRLNPGATYKSSIVPNLTNCGAVTLCTTDCDANDLAIRDMYTVQCGSGGEAGAYFLLPTGALRVSGNKVTVEWRESDQPDDAGENDPDRHRVTLEFRR